MEEIASKREVLVMNIFYHQDWETKEEPMLREGKKTLGFPKTF